jgi:type I restriction enzyme S subunit
LREEWLDTFLSEVAEVTIGRQRSPKNATGDYMQPYLRSANVKDGRLDLTDVREMNFNPDEQRVFALAPGDVLVSEGSASETQVGSNAVWHGELIGVVCFQNTLLRLRAKREVTDPAYLAAWASNAYRSGQFARIAGGSSILHIGSERAKTIAVKWPSLPEQRRIADLIGSLDAHIKRLDDEVLHLHGLLGALREALVATVSWEPVRTLAAVDGVQIGPFGSQLHAYDYVDEGVPVVMPQDIIDSEIHTTKINYVAESTAARLTRHRLRPGDLVLPRRGDLTKRAVVKPEQDGWLCGTGSIRIRLSDPTLAPALLEGLSTSRTDNWLTTNAVGTTMLNLNTEIVSKLPAPIFSEPDRELAEGCVSTRDMMKFAQMERDSLRTFRAALLSDLLSGEVQIPKSYDVLLAEAV